MSDELLNGEYDSVILSVAHDEFKALEVNNITKGSCVVYDVKGVMERDVLDGKL